eukprot:scaffold90949_cov60-Phaeocystis_antarctica.AAC.1
MCARGVHADGDAPWFGTYDLEVSAVCGHTVLSPHTHGHTGARGRRRSGQAVQARDWTTNDYTPVGRTTERRAAGERRAAADIGRVRRRPDEEAPS